jgi:hypothetical protein
MLLAEQPYNPLSDGNLITGYALETAVTDVPLDPEQLAFELSMKCSGLLLNLPE